MRKQIILVLITILFYSCSTLKYKKQGFVSNKEYLKEIPFDYINGFIFIPVTIENKDYNFLLDTGAELNLIDPEIAKELNLKQLRKGTISNAKESKKGISRVELKNIDIGGVQFQETAGMIWEISKFADLIGCVKIDGLIGNNLMRKTNWQIDYHNKIIYISDKVENFSISSSSKKMIMNSGKSGNVLLNLNIKNKTKKFTFDTGYNGFIQTGETDFLENDIYLTRVGLTGANFNGKKDGEIYYSPLKSFSINNIEFKSPSIFLIKPSDSSVLGNEFYENFIITIDWKNDYLFFDPQKNIVFEEPDFFEVSLYVDYGKNEILVSGVFKESSLRNKIKPHSRVLKINDFKVDSLKGFQLCEFWNEEWTDLKKSDELNIIIESEGKLQEFSIKKIKNVW